MSLQRVVVTAGASGIGLAIARRFMANGASVYICDINEQAIDAACAANPGLHGAVVDVAGEAGCQSLVEQAVKVIGGVDTLVNNAGIAGACAEIENISPEHWTRSFAVNVHGAFYLTRAVVPLMKAQGGGSIVNISTGSVFTLPAGRADYVASKWALEGLTRAAAKELGPFRIRVNAIRPGFINSDRMRGILSAKAEAAGTSLEQEEQVFLDYISMRTKIEPQEIGDMAVFLASQAALHVTGQLLSVDGNIEWEA